MKEIPAKKGKHILTSLIAIAKADGEIQSKERNLIYKIGEDYGYSKEEIAFELNTDYVSMSEKITITGVEETNYLLNFFRIAISDGILNANEIKVLHKMIATLGYTKEEINELIEIAQKELQKNEPVTE